MVMIFLKVGTCSLESIRKISSSHWEAYDLRLGWAGDHMSPVLVQDIVRAQWVSLRYIPLPVNGRTLNCHPRIIISWRKALLFQRGCLFYIQAHTLAVNGCKPWLWLYWCSGGPTQDKAIFLATTLLGSIRVALEFVAIVSSTPCLCTKDWKFCTWNCLAWLGQNGAGITCTSCVWQKVYQLPLHLLEIDRMSQT